MNFPLLEQLYKQVKRVITQPIAITDERGKIFQDFSDFPKESSFAVRPPNSQLGPVPVDDQPGLRAVPIFFEGKFICYVVAEIAPEDNQSISIVNSLGELIAQQFVLEHRPRPDGVDLLLNRMAYKPETIDQEELEHQMAALGYRLDLKRVAMAVELKGFWEHYLQELGGPTSEKESLIAAKKRDLNHNLANFFTKNPDNLIGFIGNDIFLVLKDLHDTDYDRFCQLFVKHFAEITSPLKNIHIQEATVGIGGACETPTDLLRSVAESLQVLKIGQKIYGSNQAYRFNDLGVLPLVLIGAEAQKKSYAERILGELSDPQLSTTLQAFLRADLNLTQTAQALKIHRNTVIYRLDKITEKLGKDPRHFPDAVELHLGLTFNRYFG